MLQCTDNKQQPVASIIDSKVQLHVRSNIPDDFQGVSEIVSDCLPKPSRVNIVTKENVLSKILRPDDLSTKGLERFHGKSSQSNFCLTNVRNLKVFLEVHGRDIAFAK